VWPLNFTSNGNSTLADRYLRDYLLLVGLSLIWGSSFSLIRIAVTDVPPMTMTAVRVIIAVMMLFPLVRLSGHRMPSLWNKEGRLVWVHFLVIGVLGNGLPFSLVGWGELEISSSMAAILIGAMPVFTVVLAQVFGIERITSWKTMVGIAVGFSGLILLVGPAILKELGGATIHELAVIGAAASYAATAVYARKLAVRLPAVTLGAGTMAASACVMIPMAFMFEAPWQMRPGADAIWAVAFLGVVSTGLASVVYFRLLASTGPTFTSMINYLIPLIGAGLGVLWLGETVGFYELLALALIIGGVALVRQRAD
jgi:drug/metabolite transporter (DMT)-like permease